MHLIYCMQHSFHSCEMPIQAEECKDDPLCMAAECILYSGCCTQEKHVVERQTISFKWAWGTPYATLENGGRIYEGHQFPSSQLRHRVRTYVYTRHTMSSLSTQICMVQSNFYNMTFSITWQTFGWPNFWSLKLSCITLHIMILWTPPFVILWRA